MLVSALTALRRGRLASAVIPAAAIGIAGIVVAQAGAQSPPRHPAVVEHRDRFERSHVSPRYADDSRRDDQHRTGRRPEN